MLPQNAAKRTVRGRRSTNNFVPVIDELGKAEAVGAGKRPEVDNFALVPQRRAARRAGPLLGVRRDPAALLLPDQGPIAVPALHPRPVF